ncbi:MAG: PepSY domain-containing protein [Hyphomicrobiaceae bacterium]
MRFMLVAVTTVFLTCPALAGPECTDQPRSKWLSVEEMVARINASQYSIDVFKVTSRGCYEIYGRNKDGRRVEIYYHPITGEQVRSRAR